MSEGKFVFGYIKKYFNIAIDKLKINSNIYIYGEPRIGKTFLAQLCTGKVSDTEYFKLHMKAYDGYNPSYYAFHRGLAQADSLYELGAEIVSNIINNSSIQNVKTIGKIIEYCSSYKQKKISHLNEAEISIINRISIHCKNRSLFLVVDDYKKWDDASKNLLNFFITPEAQKIIPFLDNSKIIIVGEDEDNIDAIKRQIGYIPSIHVKGYTLKDPFVKEFMKIYDSSASLAETLYQITNGNLGMAHDLGLYMKEKVLVQNTLSHLGELKAKKLFLSIIDERVQNINKQTPKFAITVKAASIQGTLFNQKYIPEIIGEDEFAIERTLSLAQQEHFLTLVKNEEFLYSFINNYIFQYFDEHYNEYRKEFHYKFACAAKKVHPGDYYTQYLHLRAAERNFEAAENILIYLTYQKMKNDISDNVLLIDLQQMSEDLYNCYLIICKSINFFYNGAHKNALENLDLLNPISDTLFFLKDYLTAYFIYDGGLYGRNTEACDILISNFDTLVDVDFDMWLKNGLLLYIFYVNRLNNTHEARNIEKKMMKEIAKRYRDNSTLEIIVHILNRNACALYSVEIALKKCSKSVKYFENFAHILPLEYIYALTNYSGLLLVASEYEKGYQFAYKAIRLISEKRIWIKDYRKVINNFLVNGVLSGKINYDEALEMCTNLMQDANFQESVLLKSNYYVFKALAGCYEGLLEEVEKLFWSDSVQKHNDYYVYLVGINLICFSIIMDNPTVGLKIYEDLNEIIPAICSNESYEIKRRYEIYKKILTEPNLSYSNLQSLEDYFAVNLIDFISDYAKKPYILTDQQFWSVM